MKLHLSNTHHPIILIHNIYSLIWHLWNCKNVQAFWRFQPYNEVDISGLYSAMKKKSAQRDQVNCLWSYFRPNMYLVSSGHSRQRSWVWILGLDTLLCDYQRILKFSSCTSGKQSPRKSYPGWLWWCETFQRMRTQVISGRTTIMKLSGNISSLWLLSFIKASGNLPQNASLHMED